MKFDDAVRETRTLTDLRRTASKPPEHLPLVPAGDRMPLKLRKGHFPKRILQPRTRLSINLDDYAKNLH